MPEIFFTNKIRIGTRGSPLALWQAHWIKAQLETVHEDLTVELVKIKTSGDKIQDVPLAKVGGKGLFTKEIEESMLKYGTDIAVHSMKDVPVRFPPGLGLSVVTEREDPRDVLVSRNHVTLDDLPKGAKVGTGSFRRTTQLLAYRPDLSVVPMRGNLETRLKKLETEGLDAVILAAAGLIRMDMADRISQFIEPEIMLPGGGQGAVGIESRKEDLAVMNRIFPLDHEDSHTALEAERGFLKRLEGGCQVPIGVYAIVDNEMIRLRGLVGSLDGKQIIRGEQTGSTEDPEELGFQLAGELLEKGADKILKEVYGN
ncbi:MAG: hydroxymethylbilane synthase [Nitrospinaceae bacterium]|nr:hydroxymethylbilane synthase [Nitrospinaceae bacterium]NIR56848.1 hydroxymethylbilane synthase [Nitrospinaceae bacterium]NIS87315.1 hydroxymethylbilane synthase [Nitrospinaceae bacterium]NIT84168.1 hydroxymethylbilane synthase [Nitrospinaceae bacterium]NIU46355.1 hydroxymethylbilane synthase [Nitrospinaceae bacterium]